MRRVENALTLVIGYFSSVRVGVRGVEFMGELVAKLGVEIVFDLVSRFVKMVGRHVEVAGHVALPQTMRPDQLPGRMSSGRGELELAR